MPAINFLNSIIDVVENWSKDRNPIVFGQPNRIHRKYASKPTIAKQDWKSAFNWNSKNKAVVKVNSSYYTPAGNKTTLTKKEIRQHLQEIKAGDCSTFDEWIAKLNSIHIVNIDMDTWELSECSCYYWHKHFMCNHVIAIAARLNLCDFATIAMLIRWKESASKVARKQPSHVCSVNRLIRPMQFNHQALMTKQKKRSRSLRRKNGTQLQQLNSTRASANGKIEKLFSFLFLKIVFSLVLLLFLL